MIFEHPHPETGAPATLYGNILKSLGVAVGTLQGVGMRRAGTPGTPLRESLK